MGESADRQRTARDNGKGGERREILEFRIAVISWKVMGIERRDEND